MMIINWSVEAIKWKVLIKSLETIQFIQSLKAVLSGISIGMITPNRVGEIGGRVLFLDKGQRTFGIFSAALGSLAQLTTTLLFGILGFIIFLLLFPEKIFLNHSLNLSLVLSCSLILLFLLWSFFNIKNLTPFLKKIPFLKKREEQLKYFAKTKYNILLKSLLLSFLRYIIFTTQFYLLLLMFDVSISISQAYISISLVYLFATIIPTTTLIELGIRGSLSIFFIGMFSENILGITFSTFLLWFINLAAPSIIGSIFFVKNKL